MELLTPDLGLFFWTLLAFLTVFIILRKFAWGPILKSLSERESGIAESIAAADRLKKEMAQMQNENEALMAKAREERTAMLKEARTEQERIISKAKEDTKAIADKMLMDARQQIEQQKMAALTEVKNKIGNLAVEVAEKVLRKELEGTNNQSAYAQHLVSEITLN